MLVLGENLFVKNHGGIFVDISNIGPSDHHWSQAGWMSQFETKQTLGKTTLLPMSANFWIVSFLQRPRWIEPAMGIAQVSGQYPGP